MAGILLIYGSYDGQTERIAIRIATALERMGHYVTLRAADRPILPDPAAYNAVIVGSAVHMGKHTRAIRKFARRHAAVLAQRPNAFFSVSLSAARPGPGLEAARRCVDEFCSKSGWQPETIATFAGALLYRRYNFALRALMRFIASTAGGSTDTSRDHEFTDWVAVDRFAAAFGSRLQEAAAA
jgi:menaquinone-dependent protoporphyrinogen oxidase